MGSLVLLRAMLLLSVSFVGVRLDNPHHLGFMFKEFQHCGLGFFKMLHHVLTPLDVALWKRQ